MNFELESVQVLNQDFDVGIHCSASRCRPADFRRQCHPPQGRSSSEALKEIQAPTCWHPLIIWMGGGLTIDVECICVKREILFTILCWPNFFFKIMIKVGKARKGLLFSYWRLFNNSHCDILTKDSGAAESRWRPPQVRLGFKFMELLASLSWKWIDTSKESVLSGILHKSKILDTCCSVERKLVPSFDFKIFVARSVL